ncbi:hypothetical protein MBLNU457_6420t1 [Dothideomycetes sp. NU457]
MQSLNECQHASLLSQAVQGASRTPPDQPQFRVYNKDFEAIIGQSPSLELCLEDDHPFAHEAGVYLPSEEAVFVTSNQFSRGGGQKIITINRLSRNADGVWAREEIPAEVPMANGGINYDNGILFCSQGNATSLPGLIHMTSKPPYQTRTLINNYHGRRFNSLNDVIIARDGSIWFTDPIYGYEQGICPKPELPNQVYRYDPSSGDIRAVADGFGRPNGLAFSPDEETLYVTDTDWIHGDGSTDDTRISSIYAFDVVQRSGGTFLANRRLFAMADTGIPDGIKCDLQGNVYSGCGDGLNVWNASGSLIGKIIIPGGVANFCFGRQGEIFLLNETRFWVARVASEVRGALLYNMGIDCH